MGRSTGHFSGLVAVGALIVAAASGSAWAEGAAEPAAVTIVFDGSGSIWGRLDGTKAAKLDVAKDAVRATLSRWAGPAAIGLASFGHRRRGDCSDAEIIIPPEPGTAERIGAALEKLNPRGKGPISLAVREAAGQIGSRRPASIVLITDNADNCRVDFCATGSEIAQSQPGLAVHVVGIALEADEIKPTACMAQATGGRFFDARDANQLTTSIDTALRLALKAPAPGEAQADPQLVAPPQPAQRPPPPPGKPGLAATAGLGEDGPEVASALHWRVLAADGRTTVLTADAVRLSEPLAAGRYVVEAEAGSVKTRRDVEIAADAPTTLRLTLAAGVLKLAGRHVEDAATPTMVSVYRDAAAKTAAPVLVARDLDEGLLLAPGDYHVRIEQGAVVRDIGPVTVSAGKTTSVGEAFASSRIEVSAAATGDGPVLDDALFILAKEEQADAWREIARSAARAPVFVVAPGSYRITARVGTAEAHQRIAITAGETAVRSLVLGLSRLELATVLPGSLSQGGVALSYKVSRLDGAPGVVAETSVARPKLALAAGRYRVEVMAGAQNVRGEETVTLGAGRDSQQALKVAAGSVMLRLAPASGAAASNDVYWEVADASGAVVWRTSSPEARGLLSPGRYVVRAKSREKGFERTFDLAGGEARTIEVGGS